MSAPNNNDDDIVPFSRHLRPPRQVRRTSSGSPVLRSIVRRNETLSSLNSPPNPPQNPPQPAQIPTLRPASVVPSARPLLRDTRNLLEAQRRVLTRQSDMSNPRGRPSSSWTMAEMQLEEARRQLERTNRQLEESIASAQRLLEQPLDLPPPKRRRLESTATPTEDDEKPKIHQVSYGYEGRVVPGKLDMTLEYCDGGIFEEGICCEAHGQPAADKFAVKNIFKNNSSVYCTKDSRCNIIIKHQGARPFTMKELIIKAPRNGYTSPVKEGMVFVGMDVDELMLKTAEYKIQYDKKKRERRLRTACVRYLPGGRTETTHRESVAFDKLKSAAIIPDEFVAEDEGYKVETVCMTDEEFSDEEEPDPDHPEGWRPEMPGNFMSRMANQRERMRRMRNRLTGVQANVGDALWARAQSLGMIDPDEEDSDNDDDDDDEDADGSAARRWAAQENDRYLDRERRAMEGEDVTTDTDDSDSDSEESDEDEDEDGDAADANKDAEPADAASNADVNSNVADQGSNSGSDNTPKMLPAVAQFSIQRGKSSCKMVFEPAISARYVLLKLYCPDAKEKNGRVKKGSRKGNIDVQNVTVRGFCGPRVFRSTELR